MIIVYSTTWCAYCHAVTDYLDKFDLKYRVIDIEKDASAAKDMIDKSGQMGVPVVDIDGVIIVGFDRPKIDAALKDKKLI